MPHRTVCVCVALGPHLHARICWEESFRDRISFLRAVPLRANSTIIDAAFRLYCSTRAGTGWRTLYVTTCGFPDWPWMARASLFVMYFSDLLSRGILPASMSGACNSHHAVTITVATATTHVHFPNRVGQWRWRRSSSVHWCADINMRESAAAAASLRHDEGGHDCLPAVVLLLVFPKPTRPNWNLQSRAWQPFQSRGTISHKCGGCTVSHCCDRLFGGVERYWGIVGHHVRVRPRSVGAVKSGCREIALKRIAVANTIRQNRSHTMQELPYWIHAARFTRRV